MLMQSETGYEIRLEAWEHEEEEEEEGGSSKEVKTKVRNCKEE